MNSQLGRARVGIFGRDGKLIIDTTPVSQGSAGCGVPFEMTGVNTSFLRLVSLIINFYVET